MMALTEEDIDTPPKEVEDGRELIRRYDESGSASGLPPERFGSSMKYNREAKEEIIDRLDRLQEAEQQRDDYREIIVRLKDALGLQLDGEEFTPEKVADRILDPYDRLQRVEGENRRLRKALRAAHHFIEDEARYQDGLHPELN